VLGFPHYVPRNPVFLLLLSVSKTAGGGRDTLYSVKQNQIPKKPPASLGGFFVPRADWQQPLEFYSGAQY
jgi:hypothetical protein